MFSAFQSNAFQNNAFQIIASGSVTPVITTGGGYPEEYRKHIERLERLTRTKDITKAVIEAAQAIEEIPVAAPELAKVALSASAPVEIDYRLVALELDRIQEYLLAIAKYGGMINDYMQEQEDELLILLMVN